MSFAMDESVGGDSASQPQQVPVVCCDCGVTLCIRQRTISLALGHDESAYCLHCLGKQSDVSGEQVLVNIKEYVMSRQCFRKEWIKYTDKTCCPQPSTCYLETCFAAE